MSAPWIQMRSNLPKDPHVLRLAARLKQPVAAAVGALYMLWALADEQTTDGRLVGWDAAMLDAHVGISGFAEALAAGLDAHRTDPWLTLEDGVPAVPDFDRHMSKGAKKRAIDARRKDQGREAAAASERSRTRNGEPVRDVSDGARTKLGPEKRREEKKEKTPPVSASALTSPSPKPASGSVNGTHRSETPSIGSGSERETPGETRDGRVGQTGTAYPTPRNDGFALESPRETGETGAGLTGRDADLAEGMQRLLDAAPGTHGTPGSPGFPGAAFAIIADLQARQDAEAEPQKPRGVRRLGGRTKPRGTPGFDAFYDAYPIKVGPAPAERAFAEAVRRLCAPGAFSRSRGRSPRAGGTADGRFADEAMAAAWLAERAARFAASPAGQADKVKHPQGWLNDERYFDDDDAWHRNGSQPPNARGGGGSGGGILGGGANGRAAACDQGFRVRGGAGGARGGEGPRLRRT